MKLNQIIAIVNGKKTRFQSSLSKIYHSLQKTDLFVGISRTYHPHDEEGDTFPPESNLPQTSVKDLLDEASSEMKDLFNCTFTQEKANTKACADIIVDENKLLENVPVTYLLFLEKKMVDIHTLISKLPVLAQDREWHFDDSKNLYVTDIVETNKTKKVMKSFEASPATEKHPAQVQVYNEDIVVGRWQKTDMSTGIPAKTKAEMLTKVKKVQEAIKCAREEANGSPVTEEKTDKLIDYVLSLT